VNSGSGGHHHTPTDGIDGVRSQRSQDSNGVTKSKRDEESSILGEEDRFKRVVKTEVETSVNEDTDGGNDESSVKTTDSIGSKSLLVDIDETFVFTLTTFAFGVIGEFGTGEVEGIDEHEREGSSASTRGDVFGEFLDLRGVFGSLELSLDFVLEGKVEGLSREISDAVSQVSSPERKSTLVCHGTFGTFSNTSVRLVKRSLFDHLILVLDEELDAFDWGRSGLGANGGYPRKSKVFSEGKLVS